MRNVYVVMERGEEVPESVWTTRKGAEARAKQLGSEEDVVVEEYGLLGEE